MSTDPTTPTPAAAPVSRPNQRRSRRQAPRGTTRIRAFRNAMGLGPNIGVSVLDVSETGARLMLKEALPMGQEFEINLESVAGSRSVKMIGKVVWVVPSADGKFCTGAQFTKPLPYADLQVLARS